MDSADSYFLSFTLYAIPANLISGMCYVIGRKKLGLMFSEYFFIYSPWIVLVLLSRGFFGDHQLVTDDMTLNTFILLAQSVACGVLGGSILWFRFLFRADTTFGKLRITALGALAVSAVYAVTRILLFAGIRAVI
ncbi:MAG: hypothetical protein R8K46_03910 [Mariprofundaceae bacterium]